MCKNYSLKEYMEHLQWYTGQFTLVYRHLSQIYAWDSNFYEAECQYVSLMHNAWLDRYTWFSYMYIPLLQDSTCWPNSSEPGTCPFRRWLQFKDFHTLLTLSKTITKRFRPFKGIQHFDISKDVYFSISVAGNCSYHIPGIWNFVP